MFLLLVLLINRWRRRWIGTSGRQLDAFAAVKMATWLIGMSAAAILIAGGINTVVAEPVVTNEKIFFVPFTVPSGPPESLPKLVELFVSGDQGATWESYQQRRPQEGRFTFHAGGDGTYFFATRNIDQNGQAHPEQVERPELIVIVDRTQPKLDVQTNVSPDGKIQLTWDAKDANLAPDIFSLKYRSQPGESEAGNTTSGSWQPADVRGNSQLLPGGQMVGRTTVWPPAGSRLIKIVAEARDRAGNVAVFDREVTVSGTPPNLTQQSPALPLPAGTSLPIPSVGPVPPVPPMTPPSTWPTPLAEHPSKNTPLATSWRSKSAVHAPAPHSDSGSGWASPGMEIEPRPPVANAFTTSERNSRRQRLDSSDSNFGPTSSYRVSKSRRFHIDYDVESGSEVDVYRVEVWFTDDGGRSWRHLGDDEDRVSPYLVDTQADGMYGFRLIVQAKEGLPGRPPQNGDPADVWVRVDATAPHTRMTSARFGRGIDVGTLQITWDVRDDDLRDQPIALFYSAQPSGPWRKVASELPNTGRYDWRVDDRTPDRIYLRLEATDRAGNIGVDALRDPIKSEELTPKGRIRGVRPAGHAG